MRKTALILMFLMMFCSISFAGPLMDYSAEKVAIDVSVRPSTDFAADIANYTTFNADSKGTPFTWGITTGLGNNFALQYRQFNLNTKTGDTNAYGTLRPAAQTFKELNLYYKFDKNMSVFIGALRHNYHTTDAGLTYTAPTINAFQGGVVAVTELGKDISAYGILAVGTKNVRSCEVGLSYAITPQLDLDVYYKNQKVLLSNSDNSHAKGMGYGVTYKF